MQWDASANRQPWSNMCVSLLHEYSHSNPALYSGTWAGCRQQYCVITSDAITLLTETADRNVFSVKSLWKLLVVTHWYRARQQTTLQDQKFFSSPSQGWERIPKSRFSVVNVDYKEITFHLYVIIIMYSANWTKPFYKCYIKRLTNTFI